MSDVGDDIVEIVGWVAAAVAFAVAVDSLRKWEGRRQR